MKEACSNDIFQICFLFVCRWSPTFTNGRQPGQEICLSHIIFCVVREVSVHVNGESTTLLGEDGGGWLHIKRTRFIVLCILLGKRRCRLECPGTCGEVVDNII